jgi:hypothetical protein
LRGWGVDSIITDSPGRLLAGGRDTDRDAT